MKIQITTLLACACLCFSTAAFALDEPTNLGEATDPPAGAHMTITPTSDGGAMVTIKGMKPYNNYLYEYGGPKIETVNFANGSAKIKPRTWLNIPVNGADGLYHYLLVSDENQVMPKFWMGEGVCVMPNIGHGSSITYCGWLRGYKEAQSNKEKK